MLRYQGSLAILLYNNYFSLQLSFPFTSSCCRWQTKRISPVTYFLRAVLFKETRTEVRIRCIKGKTDASNGLVGVNIVVILGFSNTIMHAILHDVAFMPNKLNFK